MASLTNEQFQAMMAAFLQPQDPDRGPGISTRGETPMISFSKEFKPRDFGFFDPDNDVDPVETKENRTVYHNVFSFINNLKVKAGTSIDTAMAVRQNLDACLLGKADRWYTEELDDIRRSGLRNDPNGVTLWCLALEKRFREDPAKALAKLESLRYTVRDARQGKDPENYIQQIILNGKNAGTVTTDYSQVMTAYEHMDPKLRVSLPMPNERTTVAEFVRVVNLQKNNWFDLYSKTQHSHGSFSANQPNNPSNIRRFDKSRTPFRLGNQSSSSLLTPVYSFGNRLSTPAFGRKKASYEKDDTSSPKQEVSRPPPQLGNQNKNQGNTKYTGTFQPNQRYNQGWRNQCGQGQGYQPTRGPQIPNHSRFPARPYQRGYVAKTSEGADPVSEEEAQQIYEDAFYQGAYWQANSGENKHDNNPTVEQAQDQSRPDEDSVEAHFTANIVARTFACKTCHYAFGSNNQLHKHLRSDRCTRGNATNPRTTIKASIQATRGSSLTMETPQPLPESTSSTWNRDTTNAPPIPATVVRSAAVESSAKKGYTFRGWRYATAQASLGMTGFLIHYYAAIIKPLQLRKTALNRSLHEKISSIGGNARKKFVGRLGVSAPTLKELCAFRYLQSLFSRQTMLVHHDPKRQVYIDMDGSKARGHGAYAYHVLERSGSPMDLRVPNRSSQSCF